MNDEQQVRLKYKAFIGEVNCEQLDLELKTPNIFSVLGVSRTEIRHSNFLAWLLNPKGAHGLGELFLKKFIIDIVSSQKVTNIDELDVEGFDFSDVEIKREWKNIDILIIFKSEKLVFCIENKVDTADHSNQLARYRKIVNEEYPSYKKAFVYLTPMGADPLDEKEQEYYSLYSYEEISERIEKLLQVYGENINPKVMQYIADYLLILKRNLMKNDPLNELAEKIYRNHKDLIDFVYENKTDILSDLSSIIMKKIESHEGFVLGSQNKGLIRFTTTNLEKIIPKTGKHWSNREPFLFELDCRSMKNIILKTVLQPHNEKIEGSDEIRFKIHNALDALPEHKTPAPKWAVHFSYKLKGVNKDMFEELDEEKINKVFDNNKEAIMEMVNKVEKAIVEEFKS